MLNKRMLLLILGLFLFGYNHSPLVEPAPKVTSVSQNRTTSIPRTNRETETKNVLVLADISSDPTKINFIFRPLTNYLTTRLHSFGIEKGIVKIALDIDTTAEWIKTGQTDLYLDEFPEGAKAALNKRRKLYEFTQRQ